MHHHRQAERLAAELAETHAVLDELAARIARAPAGDRALLEPKLIHLRDLWNEAQFAYNVGEATAGRLRAEDERSCRAALDEVERGLFGLVAAIPS